MLTTEVIEVGTTETRILHPVMRAQQVVLQNLEPNNEGAAYSREGLVYLVDQVITIPSLGTALFLMQTPADGAQFEFWNFTSNSQDILGQLIEGGTITSNGTAVPAYNMNRQDTDTYNTDLFGATAITGGTVIVQEYITAGKKSGGDVSSGKIVTLKGSSDYGFKFENKGIQTTTLHLQIGFSESFNGLNDIWVNGAAGETMRLRGGESVTMNLYQAEEITAIALQTGKKLAIVRHT